MNKYQLLLAAGFAVGFTSPAAAQVNQIYNPGFEMGPNLNCPSSEHLAQLAA